MASLVVRSRTSWFGSKFAERCFDEIPTCQRDVRVIKKKKNQYNLYLWNYFIYISSADGRPATSGPQYRLSALSAQSVVGAGWARGTSIVRRSVEITHSPTFGLQHILIDAIKYTTHGIYSSNNRTVCLMTWRLFTYCMYYLHWTIWYTYTYIIQYNCKWD